MSSNVRVRFAPSPTGHLHVGGARTALFNYLFAKSQCSESKFILRAEDTDKERSSEEFLKSQLKDLYSLGIIPDEGVSLDEAGNIIEKDEQKNILTSKSTTSYKQSKRSKLNIYKDKIEFLLQNASAYYCFLTDEDIDVQKNLAKENKSTQQIVSPYRPKNLEDAKEKIFEAKEKIQQGKKPSIRFNTSSAKPEYIIKDLVRGEVKLPSDMVGDFVIQRSNGMPVYNFCCVVDDALMKISHVLRAEEHLSNTLRQLMIYEALNFKIPQFAHMSLILGEDKKKLSKRHGATSVENYLKEGYLPEALVNFLCLLGWSHPEAKEIFTLSDVVKIFTLKRLNPAPAVFDTKKLLWMNGEYIKNLDTSILEKMLGLEKYKLSVSKKEKILILCSAVKTLTEAKEILNLIFGSLKILEEANEVLAWSETKNVLNIWQKKLEIKEAASASSTNPTASASSTNPEHKQNLTEEEFITIQNEIKETCQVKGKYLFMPIRVAVIGKPHGAELKELVPLISINNLITRTKTVIKKIETIKND